MFGEKPTEKCLKIPGKSHLQKHPGRTIAAHFWARETGAQRESILEKGKHTSRTKSWDGRLSPLARTPTVKNSAEEIGHHTESRIRSAIFFLSHWSPPQIPFESPLKSKRIFKNSFCFFKKSKRILGKKQKDFGQKAKGF